MQNTEEKPTEKDVNWNGFMFNFLRNNKIPYWIMVLIFVTAIFLIPKLLVFQFGLGLSWTNVFFISQEFIDQFPVFWGAIDPILDYFNILGLVGITVFLVYNKSVYKQFYCLKLYVAENVEKQEDIDIMNDFNRRIKLGMKTIPRIFMLLAIVGIPLFDFFLFNSAKFEASMNPNKVLFYIQNYYGLAIMYAFFICMLIMTFVTSFLIWRLSNRDVKHYVMHEDGVAGLKIFGDTTMKNILSWTVLAIVVVVNAAILAMSRTDGSRMVIDFIIIIGTLLITIIMYYVPISGAHSRLLKEKQEAIEKIDEDFSKLLKILKEDKGKIGQSTDPVNILPRLDFIVRSNYFSNILSLKEWPIDNNIIIKTVIAIAIPIFLSVFGYIIQTFLFGG